MDSDGLAAGAIVQGIARGAAACAVNTPCRNITVKAGQTFRDIYRAIILTDILNNDSEGVDEDAQIKSPVAGIIADTKGQACPLPEESDEDKEKRCAEEWKPQMKDVQNI